MAITIQSYFFNEYKEIEHGDVLLGDNLSTKIVGRGKVRLMLKDISEEPFWVYCIYRVLLET